MNFISTSNSFQAYKFINNHINQLEDWFHVKKNVDIVVNVVISWDLAIRLLPFITFYTPDVSFELFKQNYLFKYLLQCELPLQEEFDHDCKLVLASKQYSRSTKFQFLLYCDRLGYQLKHNNEFIQIIRVFNSKWVD